MKLDAVGDAVDPRPPTRTEPSLGRSRPETMRQGRGLAAAGRADHAQNWPGSTVEGRRPGSR